MGQTSVYTELIYFPVVLAAMSKSSVIHFPALLPAIIAATIKANGFISHNCSPPVCPHFHLPKDRAMAQAARLSNRALNPGRGIRFFSSPKTPDRLWGPPGLLFNRRFS